MVSGLCAVCGSYGGRVVRRSFLNNCPGALTVPCRAVTVENSWNFSAFRAAQLEQSGIVMSIEIEQALLSAATQQSVSTGIVGSYLFRPPNVDVGVCNLVWRPMRLSP